jgi:[citrate (pro-3S)-lyase] ligase
METICGSPFRGAAIEEMKSFLKSCGISYDDGVQFSVCLMDGGRMAAAGSIDGGVLKCIAVSPDYQGEGLAAAVVSELVSHAAREGRFHLFIFTKSENAELFGGLGFYPIAKTERALLMENRKNGIADFVSSLRVIEPEKPGPVGCVVANCNPFTLGHLYLMETASKQCGLLHVFILSEDKSEFPASVRRALVEKGVGHLSNVLVQPTGPYLVSAATFPSYFYKEASEVAGANGELDLRLFAERIARPLGIQRRFVGTEPYSPLTGLYNLQMQEILPSYGIEVTEIPRLEAGSEAVSASRVRKLLEAGSFDALKELVPPVTYTYIMENYPRP